MAPKSKKAAKTTTKSSCGSRTVEELLASYGPDDFIMGIDEAGRGPVLGPMVYAAAFCRLKDSGKLRDLGAGDSKKIAEKDREQIADKIKESTFCEYFVVPIHPKFISSWMQRRTADCTLNTISHDSAIMLINRVLQVTGGPPSSDDGGSAPLVWEPQSGSLVAQNVPCKGFETWKSPCNGRLRGVYVDTVGIAAKYQEKLSELFPFLHITVESKADDTFPIVGAASIMAKTTRDAMVSQWAFEEGPRVTRGAELGSGYPADPQTKQWLVESIDKVFGFPNLVRFSWGTAKRILETGAVGVTFEDPPEAGQSTLFRSTKKRRRCQYLEELKVEHIDKL